MASTSSTNEYCKASKKNFGGLATKLKEEEGWKRLETIYENDRSDIIDKPKINILFSWEIKRTFWNIVYSIIKYYKS